jgi:predicted branched-subunit amino acid permease
MAQLSRPHVAGHVLGISLGLSHLSILGLPTDGDQAGPPLAVLILGAAVGLAIVVLLIKSWRSDAHVPRRIAAVLLVLAALGALPGLLVADVDVMLQIAAGALVLLTIATLILLFYPQRSIARTEVVR